MIIIIYAKSLYCWWSSQYKYLYKVDYWLESIKLMDLGPTTTTGILLILLLNFHKKKRAVMRLLTLGGI